MPIIVYNRANEDHSLNPNNYPIYRGGSILGNPYTDKPLERTLAVFKAKNREDAIEKYSTYFDAQYGHSELPPLNKLSWGLPASSTPLVPHYTGE